MQSLGDRIREYRTSIKMTQTDFALRLGVTGASVSAYENGSRLPSYEVLIKIADVLGVSTDELLGRKKSEAVTIDVTQLSPKEVSIIRDLVDALTENKSKVTVAVRAKGVGVNIKANKGVKKG